MNFTNPTNSLNTHQYNFLLLASPNTNCVKDIFTMSNGEISDKAVKKAASYKVGQKFLDNATGNYFIPVLNTFIDGNFNVDRCVVTTEAPGGAYPGVVSDLQLYITEPKSIYFLNLIKQIHSVLNINQKNVIYKLIVTGQGFDSQGQCVSHYTTPFTLCLKEGISISVNSTGGKYVMNFVECGSGTLDTITNMQSNITFNTLNATTVGYALKNLETMLNNRILVTKTGVTKEGGNIKDTFIQITCPEIFNNARVDRSIFDSHNEASGVKQGPGFVYDKEDSITSIIADILLSSSDITSKFNIVGSPDSLGGGGTSTSTNVDTSYSVSGDNGNKQLFNITTAITSDETSTTYHFDVVSYDYNTFQEPDIIYNYDFTGLNTEIIDYKMHIEGGENYAFIENVDGSVTGTDIPRSNDPAPPAKQSAIGIEDSLLDVSKKAKIDYIKSFALAFARNKASSTMIIRGNLNILQRLYTTLPHCTPVSSDTQEYLNKIQEKNKIFKSRALIIKVNTYTPKSTDNNWGDSFVLRDTNGKAIESWTTNNWLVYKIVSTFTGSKFTQEFRMIGMFDSNVFNNYQTSTNAQNSSTQALASGGTNVSALDTFNQNSIKNSTPQGSIASSAQSSSLLDKYKNTNTPAIPNSIKDVAK